MSLNSAKRANADGSGRDGKRQRVEPTPQPPFVRMPEPWYPVKPSSPPTEPIRASEMPYNPVPEHLRMKMPQPEDIDMSLPCSAGCTGCWYTVQSSPPVSNRGAGSNGQRQPQQSLAWTTYDNSNVTPQNPYARPITYYGPQPPANAPRPVMWWATTPNPNPPPFPYDARRNDPYRRQ